MLPPLDDELARATSEFDTLDELRGDIEGKIREQLEEDVEGEFRQAAVDELVKASNVEPAGLVVEVRTRELLNAFIRNFEARGIDAAAYLQATGVSPQALEQRLRDEARLVDRARARARGGRRQARHRGRPTTRSASSSASRARTTRTSRSSSRPAAPTACATTSA